MGTGSGGNWKLTIRREERGVVLLQAVTCDRRAVLPERVQGLPVIGVGNHALSPTGRPAEGETVLLGGGDPEDWSNRGLEDLTLPRTLERIEDYALMNCSELETLRLYDGIRLWGGGALTNCRRLRRICLTRVGEQGDTLACLADELPWELDVTVTGTDGAVARLIFPEYQEVYEENCPAHHFDYNIYGAGYPYHHVFRHKRLDLRAYDELWPGFLGMEHEERCAVQLAFWRLWHPAELMPRARERYAAYLRAHGAAAALWLVEEQNPRGLAFLLRQADLSREELAEAAALAREQGGTELLAILLEAQHRRGTRGLEKSFDL